MAPDVHHLEHELLYLHKSAGVTPERIAATGVLRRILGGKQTPYTTLVGRLTSGIASLHKEDFDFLLDVFGFNEETRGLSKLRERLARVTAHALDGGLKPSLREKIKR